MPHLLFALACADAPDSEGRPAPAPPPWADLEVPLDPFRELLTVDVGPDARQLLPVGAAPSLAVWPGPRGGVALLDARYGLGDGPRCLDPAPFTAALDGVDRRGACAEGEVELDRTGLAVGLDVRDVADDPEGGVVTVLLPGGALGVANTDLLVGNPFDWLRLAAGPTLRLPTAGVPVRVAALPGGGWAAASGTELAWFDGDGALQRSRTLEGTAERLLVAGDAVWAATDAGLEGEAGVVVACAAAPGVAADGAGGVWAACRSEGSVVHVDAGGAEVARVAVEGLTGPVARHPGSGAIYALTEDGVAELRDGLEVARRPIPDARAISINAAGEVAVLSGRTVSVFVDETALADRPPLSGWIAAFIENPRAEATRVDCSGDDAGMTERSERALANRALFDDFPAPVALAVSPAVAAHARRCKVREAFHDATRGARIEPGVLLHDPPDCADQACLDEAIADELDQLGGLGVVPRFAAGAAGWQTGGDWVLGLTHAGLDRHAFVGLSADPNVGIDDPRAKDGWPWSGLAEGRPVGASSAATATIESEGALLLVPGNTQAAFNLADCPGALQAECRMLDLGGGSVLGADDLAVADLLLHRAAAMRGGDGVGTWYFHLPAIEEYDYTKGCTRDEDGTWQGETCQAAALQRWLFDVHGRLVRAGVVRWSCPSGVGD
jgi:hypothetical protein